MKLRFFLITLFWTTIFIIFSMAQIPDSLADSEDILRVYVDCDYCDYPYFVENILFVNFVRDAYLSQVQVIISTEHTASGGHRFNLRFIGREKYSGMEQTLSYNSTAFESDDQQRQGLTQVLKMGLMPYLSQTSLAPALDIKYRMPSNGLTPGKMSDTWNYWVFQLEMGGGLEAEEQRNAFKIEGSVKVNRITEQWRLGLDVDYDYEEENIKEAEEEEIQSILDEREIKADVVKSLSSHWSTGLFAEVYSTTYRNIDLGTSFSPALQYNIYPWKESSQRLMAIAYHIGIRTFEYIEETLYDKTAESRFYESLGFQWEMIQPWGEVNCWLEGSHYFQDFAKNRVILDTYISLRLVKGFSLFLDIELESIHDQIYLPKGGASLEEILLKRRQLATTFNYSTSFGVSYTFGSIYNNIVNRRLH
jgi:hypothetical protein